MTPEDAQEPVSASILGVAAGPERDMARSLDSRPRPWGRLPAAVSGARRKCGGSFVEICMLLVCGVYLFVGLDYDGVSLAEPGAGLLPLVIGVAWAVSLGAVVVEKRRRRARAEESLHSEPTEPLEPELDYQVAPVLAVVVLCFAFVLLVPYLGFLLASGLTAAAVIQLVERRWSLLSAIVGLFLAVAMHAIFVVCLDVRLPVGVFGI